MNYQIIQLYLFLNISGTFCIEVNLNVCLKEDIGCKIHFYTTTRIPEMLGRFLNLNKMKTKRISNHMSQHFYGANFVPIFIKQIQCFANKHNLLCKEKLDFQTNAKWFANTKLHLRENAEVWTNICIVCYNCETHLPFYEEMWLDFLTNACWQIFSQMRAGWFSHKCVRAGWFSHKCMLADFLTNASWLIFSDAQLSNFLFQKTADGAVGQFMSGEQVSFCLTISIFRCFHKTTLLQCQWNSQQVL